MSASRRLGSQAGFPKNETNVFDFPFICVRPALILESTDGWREEWEQSASRTPNDALCFIGPEKRSIKYVLYCIVRLTARLSHNFNRRIFHNSLIYIFFGFPLYLSVKFLVF